MHIPNESKTIVHRYNTTLAAMNSNCVLTQWQCCPEVGAMTSPRHTGIEPRPSSALKYLGTQENVLPTLKLDYLI